MLVQRFVSRISAQDRKVAFSNPDKVFFPKDGFTKGDLIKYYLEIAPFLLPHFRDRPVTLIRMPNGVRGESFYEKNAPSHTPEWVETTAVPRSEGGSINYLLINDAATLAWCANNGAVELHPFLHRAQNLHRPTHVAFDLDPGEGADLLSCIEVGFMIRELLTSLKLEVFPKVSGSKGLQLYVPLNTAVTYEATTPFAKAIAELLHRQHPKLIVADMPKALRVNRVLIDWSQNSEKKTTVGPYSVRGKRDEPFVSAPVSWEELRRVARSKKIADLFFSPSEMIKRVKKIGDLYAPVLTLKQKLPAAFTSAVRGAETAPRSLRRYAEMRDFSRTAEPAPQAPAAKSHENKAHRFVIQKHAASHLHYDFRLELDGVLKSWAVPKGLSTEVGVKRSAFQTEDHPLEYFKFEGTIPHGQYGGGTVMVWDIGTYEILGGSIWNGDLKLQLSGKKLKGEWHIFRIKSEDENKPVWLVQKAKEAAKPISERQENTSVLSGRTLEQIAAANDAVWQSNRPAAADDSPSPPDAPADSKVRAKKKSKIKSRETAELPPEPGFVEPMTAREVKELPDDGEWILELKFDGYRGLGTKHGEHASLRSRNDKDLGGDFPEIVAALQTLNARVALLDGEIVALGDDGKPSFQRLQHRSQHTGSVVYYAFDLLSFDGEDWQQRPLEERKAKLAEIVNGSEIKLSPVLDVPPATAIAAVRQMGLEGVVAKQRGSAYEPGARAWLKFKSSPEQEFVIGGYKRGLPLESLVVGYHNEQGALCCAGKVRQGLNPRNRRELQNTFKKILSEKCPFVNLPTPKKGRWGEGIDAAEMDEIQWLEPKMVAQISFTQWTDGGNLRHGEFKGLRTDKAAHDVVREA